MPGQMNREDCVQALCAKAAETERLPKKSDFTESEVAKIKAFFGPWPRALEAAGLIQSNTEEKVARKKESRITAKKRKTEAIKKQKQ